MATIWLNSRFSLGGTLALAAAVLMTAGISPGAQAAGDYGVLRLQLGTANQFVLEVSTTEKYYQPFSVEPKGSCLVDWSSGTPYGELLAAVGQAADGSRTWVKPGFGATSLGAWDGPKGTPCSRVSYSVDEALRFGLGPDVGPKTTRADLTYANAFDRLELDVEVKADAALQLVTYLGSAETGRFYLQTGTSITSAAAPPMSDGQPVDSSPALPVVSCSARSDSGPDSGPNDNCRWVIKDVVGQSFVIRPLVGEFSLEGGGDWEGMGPDVYLSKQSYIYLTWVDEGALTCDGSTRTLRGATTCTVSGAPTGYCPTSSIYYFFREVSGVSSGCEFIKASDGQLVASIEIAFPPEPADLNATRVLFPKPDGSYAPYAPTLCTGTVVGLNAHPTIKEVLETVKPAGYVDVVPATAAADWACILDQTVTDAPEPAPVGWIQVYQRILFWGDPLIVRQ